MALIQRTAALVLAAAILPLAAHAQVTLEEIVVTAQKRSENVQDVPIAVQTINASALERASIGTTQDLQFAVPALLYNNAANNAQPFLRGIGSDTNGPNYDVSVATYVDGVFISSNSGVIQNLLGVERVEVLEGPQGTLYGRNAVGGAINVYTLTPTQTFQAKMTAGLGNYNEYTAKGFVSGGVNDNLAVGLYFGYQNRDSYYTRSDPSPHDPTLGDTTQPTHDLDAGIRAKAVWTPTDAVKLTGSAEYTNFSNPDMGSLRNIQVNGAGYALGAPHTIEPYFLDSNQPQETIIHTTALTLREEVNLGWSSILGISAWRNLNLTGYDDLDGTSAPLAGTGTPHSPAKQYSQELQLLSPADSAIKWIGGLYYFHEYTGYNPVITNSAVLFQPSPVTISANDADVTTNSYAAFGQATIPLDFIANSLRLTLGARYTEDRKSITADGYSMTALGGSVVGPVTSFPDASKSWSKFTPKVTLDYKIDQTLLYATYGKGFKSGAFNISTPSAPETSVDPENLTAYEVGTKSDLADGRLRLNTSAYFYSLKDLQVEIVSGGEGGRTSIQNAADGQAYGLEANLTAALTTELKMNVGLAWEHTRYTNFDDAASFAISTGPVGALNINSAAVFDATGNEMQRAPKFISTVGADYTHPLSNGGSLDATLKWYYNGGFFWEPTNRFKQDAYSIVNLSVGYALPDHHTSIMGYVTNLTNAYYANSILVIPFSVLTSDGEPRMYGMNVTWNF
jgi:iron complex outermembrane recepter protein